MSAAEHTERVEPEGGRVLSITERMAGDRPARGMTAGDLADARLVDRLAEAMRSSWRHTASMGWLMWSGVVWEEVADTAAVDAVRLELLAVYEEAVAEAATQGEDGAALARRASTLLTARTIESLARLLRGPLTEDGDAFDADPWVLVCENGVIDLRSRELMPHDPDRLVTRSTGVEYDPRATHPVWARALDALPDDETRAWMRRRLGQALVGHLPPDLATLYWLGSGRNGKSGMLTGLRRALGAYATIADPSILEPIEPGAATPSRMQMRGRRLVILEELSDDPRRTLSLTTVKRLTSGQSVPARGLYKDEIKLVPTWAIIVAANSTPPIVETDDGSWRRVLRVPAPWRYVAEPRRPEDRPLDATVLPTMRDDPDVPAAVLAWLVRGLAEAGDAEDLAHAPESVQEATEAWREEADVALGYIRECLVPADGSAVLLRDVTAHVRVWLRARSQTPWSEGLVRSRIGGHDALAEAGARLRTGARTRVLAISRPTDRASVGDGYPWETGPGHVPVPAQATVIEGVRFRH